jgi:ABC-type transport system involved in multi-copper enzyme maturation permease subunit
MKAEERGPGSGVRGLTPAHPEASSLAEGRARGWGKWVRQALAVARLELRKCFRGRHLVGVTLLNLAPVLVLALMYLMPEEKLAQEATPTNLSKVYAVMFATFMTRVGIFFTSGILAIKLFRNEVLEKTLHYYFLTPVKRSITVVGKFMAACVASSLICGIAVAASYGLLFGLLGDGFSKYYFGGPGLGHLLAYLGVTVLGCVGYGAVFALFGLLWRNPIIAVLTLLGWESVLFLLPPFLKLVSVLFYLESLLPYRPPVGPLAVLAEPPPALASIVGIFVFAALVLVLAGWRATRMEISYSTD